MFSRKVDNEISIALVQESFAAQYCQIVTDQVDYLSQWLAWPPHCQSEQDFRIFIQRSLHDYAEGKSMTCAIIYQGRLVGNCSFNSINHCTKSAEVGYWLSKQYQGKGIITRVVQHLINMAFEELDMLRVQLSAAVDNQPSRKVAERLDMKLEGVLTQQEKVGDRVLDHAIYAIKTTR